MSTMLPTEAEIRTTGRKKYRAHIRSPSNQHVPIMRISTGITKKPTRKSETARERRRRFVGEWSFLQEDQSIINNMINKSTTAYYHK